MKTLKAIDKPADSPMRKVNLSHKYKNNRRATYSKKMLFLLRMFIFIGTVWYIDIISTQNEFNVQVIETPWSVHIIVTQM